jgi:SAM-dependent methyltransferase
MTREPQSGQAVLDFGCGTGLDTLLATRWLGSSGQAIGVDMTPRMVAKARSNAEALGLGNIEFLSGEIGRLPLPDAAVDLVISNGMFNLCPEKSKVLDEVYWDRSPNQGSPAFSMMTADSRPGPTTKSWEIDAAPSSWRAWIIETAGEP